MILTYEPKMNFSGKYDEIVKIWGHFENTEGWWMFDENLRNFWDTRDFLEDSGKNCGKSMRKSRENPREMLEICCHFLKETSDCGLRMNRILDIRWYHKLSETGKLGMKLKTMDVIENSMK